MAEAIFQVQPSPVALHSYLFKYSIIRQILLAQRALKSWKFRLLRNTAAPKDSKHHQDKEQNRPSCCVNKYFKSLLKSCMITLWGKVSEEVNTLWFPLVQGHTACELLRCFKITLQFRQELMSSPWHVMRKKKSPIWELENLPVGKWSFPVILQMIPHNEGVKEDGPGHTCSL